MALVKVVTVLLIASCVSADVLNKRKCPPGTDAAAKNCLKLSIQNFLRDQNGGIPDLGIKALDPFYTDQIEAAEDDLNFKSVFPVLRVTGFRNVIIEDASDVNDTDAGKISMKFDFVAEGPLSIKFPKKKKAYIGYITYEGGASADITHTYSPWTVHVGSMVQTRYETGPEQIACKFLHAKSKVNPELTAALTKDPDVQAVMEQWAQIEKDHQDRVVCAIAKQVFQTALNNIRAHQTLGLQFF